MIRFGDMLSAGNIQVGDLLTIDRHVGNRGENRLCFNHILGHCPHMARGRCTGVYVIGTDLSNNSVVNSCCLVTPGVDSMMNDGSADDNNNCGDGRGEGAM